MAKPTEVGYYWYNWGSEEDPEWEAVKIDERDTRFRVLSFGEGAYMFLDEYDEEGMWRFHSKIEKPTKETNLGSWGKKK